MTPDDTLLAINVSDLQDLVAICELSRNDDRQLSSVANSDWPMRTHDGKSVIVVARRDDGANRIVEADAVGNRPHRELGWSPFFSLYPGWISGDGRTLGVPGGAVDLSRGGQLIVRDWKIGPGHGDISPDGRWLAAKRDGEI